MLNKLTDRSIKSIRQLLIALFLIAVLGWIVSSATLTTVTSAAASELACYGSVQNGIGHIDRSRKIRIIHQDGPPENAIEREYLLTAEKLLREWNERLLDTDTIGYDFLMLRYNHRMIPIAGRALTAGVICVHGTKKGCRNLNFFIDGRVKADDAARIVIGNVLLDQPKISACEYKKRSQ